VKKKPAHYSYLISDASVGGFNLRSASRETSVI